MAQIKLNNFRGSIVFKYKYRDSKFFDKDIIKMLFPESIFFSRKHIYRFSTFKQ